MSYKVKTNEVDSAAGSLLAQYTADVQYEVIKLTDETADKLLRLIKNQAPVDWRKVKRRGKYKRSWKIKTTKDTFAVYEKTVYASGGEHRLTHLLEFGHKTKSGGKTKAQSHIKPAADRMISEYVEETHNILRRSQMYGGGLRKYKKTRLYDEKGVYIG